MTIWGTGSPRREFLHVDDLADASLFVLNLPGPLYEANTQKMLSHINVGFGTDISIRELARLIAKVVGFEGSIRTDPNKPDGTAKKLLDISRLATLGWQASIDLEEGLQQTYEWFLANQHQFRG